MIYIALDSLTYKIKDGQSRINDFDQVEFNHVFVKSLSQAAIYTEQTLLGIPDQQARDVSSQKAQEIADDFEKQIQSGRLTPPLVIKPNDSLYATSFDEGFVLPSKSK